MNTLFETQVKIGISDADFKKGIATAGAMVKDFATVGVQALGSVTKSIASVSQELVKGVSDLAAYGDHIDKQSQKMNMSAKAYQEWDAVLKHSGTSIDSMQASIKTLSTAVESGNDAFELLGLSLEEVQSLNGEELFSRTITALQNVEDDTKRTYLAGQLLGRGATELGALLNTSAKDTELMRQRVHELGGVLSDTAVKDAAKFQDSLQDVQTSIEGLKNNFKAELLPSFVEIMDGLTSVITGEEGGEQLITKGVNDVITSLSKSADKLKSVIKKLGESAFNVARENLPQIVKRSSQLLSEVVTDVIRELPQILNDAGGIISTIGETLTENIPQLAGAAKLAITSLAGYLRDNLPQLIPQGTQAVTEFIKGLTSPEVSGTLINAAFDVVGGLIDGLTSSETINAILDNAPVIVENIATGIVNGADKLADAALQLCGNLLDYFSNEENRKKLLQSGEKILDAVVEGFTHLLGTGVGAVYNLGGMIAENIGLGEYWKVGNKCLTEWSDGFKEKWNEFKSWWNIEITDVFNPVKLAEKIKEAMAGIGDALKGNSIEKQDENGHGGGGRHSSARGPAGAQYDYSDAVIIEPYKESVLPNEYRLKHGDLEARKRASYHATGAIIDYPLTTHVFGEAGREAVLPLDSNTGWMDKLASKIGNRNTTVNIYHTGSLNEEADFDRFIEKLDNALANRYIGQDRSIGVTLA